jgi:hypothetical protein
MINTLLLATNVFITLVSHICIPESPSTSERQNVAGVGKKMLEESQQETCARDNRAAVLLFWCLYPLVDRRF